MALSERGPVILLLRGNSLQCVMFVVLGRLEWIWGVGLSPSFSSPKEFGLALLGDVRVGSVVYYVKQPGVCRGHE